MKKLKASVLAVVLSAPFMLVRAQEEEKKDTAKTRDIEGVTITSGD